MSTKTNNQKETKKRVIALLEQFDWMFSINNFDRNLKWCDQDEDGKIAEIEFHEDYQIVNIRIYPIFFTLTAIEQRKALLHEFCHVITIPGKKAIDDCSHGRLITEERNREINETATSKIENLLDKLLQGNLTYAREAYKKYSMAKKAKKVVKKMPMKKMKKAC